MNSVHLLGRLTSDPELRQTQNGIACCRFTIAVDRGFKNKQGERESDFITCLAWKQTAEFIAKYWTKGRMIAVTGSLHTGKYQDKNHPDVTHYTTDVMVNNAFFCGDKSNSQPTAQGLVNQAKASGVEVGNLSEYEDILSDGDIPF